MFLTLSDTIPDITATSSYVLFMNRTNVEWGVVSLVPRLATTFSPCWSLGHPLSFRCARHQPTAAGAHHHGGWSCSPSWGAEEIDQQPLRLSLLRDRFLSSGGRDSRQPTITNISRAIEDRCGPLRLCYHLQASVWPLRSRLVAGQCLPLAPPASPPPPPTSLDGLV